MVGVFVSLCSKWAKDLDCKIFQFLHEDQAKQWMLNKLVLSGEVCVVDGGWDVGGKIFEDMSDAIEEFQNRLEPSEYFNIYPLESMVSQPTGRSSQLAIQ